MVNEKRVRRLWRQHRLQVPRLRRRRSLRKPPTERLLAAYPGHIWAYDFVEDALVDGTTLRILTVMDEFTREGLALDVEVSASAERVLGVLAGLIAQHGAPGHLRSDNGPEFVATAVKLWLAQRGVQTLYIDAGKPWQNGKEERFNGTVRDECLNLHAFGSVAEAWMRLSAFREEYNTVRPHSQLGYLTPCSFKAAGLKPRQSSRILTSTLDGFRVACHEPPWSYLVPGYRREIHCCMRVLVFLPAVSALRSRASLTDQSEHRRPVSRTNGSGLKRPFVWKNQVAPSEYLTLTMDGIRTV